MQMNSLDKLQKDLGYTFADRTLLLKALTHVSYTKEKEIEEDYNYERLEFLGDAVLELVVSDYIYRHIDGLAGDLSRLRASLVSATYLQDVATKLSLQKYIIKSKSLSQLSKKTLADLFESVVGAVYLDGGMAKAKDIIEKFIVISEENIKYVQAHSPDFKTKLQEFAQAQGKQYKYKLTKSYGMDHEKTFEISLIVDGVIVAKAIGSSIQQAESKCAQMYLNAFGVN